MSNKDVQASDSVKSDVRLRKPNRMQVQMLMQCPDDLVPAGHAVRTVAALVATLDLSRFCEPIKAREGQAGRDATDPQLLVSLWLYGCIRGIGSARELALLGGRGKRAVPLALRRREREPPALVGNGQRPGASRTDDHRIDRVDSRR